MPLNPMIVDALRKSGELSEATAARFNPPVEPRIIPGPSGTSSAGTSMSVDPAMYASNEPIQDYGVDDDSVLATDIQNQPAYDDGSMPQTQSVSMGGGMGNFDDAYRIQQEGAAKAYGAEADQAKAESKFQGQMYEEAERQRTENLKRDAEDNAILDEKFSVLNQKMDDYAKSPKTLSEQFAKKTTGQKIGASIALFLGAAPNSAGQNKAVMTMQAALDDDLRAQEQDVANFKGLYNDLKDTFQDRREARKAATIAYINNAQIKLQQIASQYKSPIIQGNYEMLFGKLEAEKEKLKNELQLDWLSKAAQQRDNNMKMMETFVPGMGFALTKEDAAKLKEEGGSTFSALGNIKNIKSMAKGSMLNPNTRNKVQQEIGLLVGQLRIPVTGPGAFTDSEREFIKDLVGNPTKIFGLKSLEVKKLDQLENILKRSRAAKAKAYGLSPVEDQRQSQDVALE